MGNVSDTLYVLYTPVYGDIPQGAPVLSFLSPQKEDDLRKTRGSAVVSAREMAPRVKDDAVALYTDIVAKIGAAPCGAGETLRTALKNKDGVSLWWFHKVSEKDCESEQTFRFITEILIIRSAAADARCGRIVLVGGSAEVAGSLRSLYAVETVRCARRYGFWYFARGVLSRMKYLLTSLGDLAAVKLTVRTTPAGPFDIVFSGFWDWSLKENPSTGKLEDRYFKALPEALAAKGLRTAWFLWFDPAYEPGTAGRRPDKVLRPLRRHDNLVILQKYIGFRQLLQAVFNVKPLAVLLRFLRDGRFRGAFKEKGVDMLPLLKGPLLYGFMNLIVPYKELVYEASRRAFGDYRPKAAFSFLEFFVHSRAFYAGGKRGSPATVQCAMQHAGYCREKTFMVFDPSTEYGGDPDGCAMPKPEYLFAMGSLGKEIFMENGFSDSRVFLTGSARYDHIRQGRMARPARPDGQKSVLIVTAMEANLDMEMVAAVHAASEGLPGVRLRLRNHPFEKIDTRPDFIPYKERIDVSAASLEEDLRGADLVIFSYSTVAAEAFIRGIPVWQWLPVDFNGSVFRDLKGLIRTFCSVGGLRGELERFLADPAPFVPGDAAITHVMEKCFYKGDGKACERIADRVAALVAQR